MTQQVKKYAGGIQGFGPCETVPAIVYIPDEENPDHMICEPLTPKPFGTAWQTNYTGEEWHFAPEVSFSDLDIERGIVRNMTPLFVAEPEQIAEAVDDTDRMQKISEVILHLQSIQERFGDTCVYIRRGGMSWGAVALNRRDDDKKNGVFDLQAQHDRDMTARLQQVERLIGDNRDLRAQISALSAPPSSKPEAVSDADFPAGAIENGRVYIERLERDYQFNCEAGPLTLCSDWIELVRCFEYMADYLGRAALSTVEGGK
jgi:hypothetical protein